MKIAFIVTIFPKLSETFVLNQITGLMDRGHEVDIYAERRATESKVHPDVEKYQLLERTYYHVIPRNKCWRLLKGLGILLTNFHRSPRAILNSLNICRLGMHAITLYTLYGIPPFLKNGPYDIIHCQFGENGNKAIMLKEVGAVTGKLITTFRGHDMYQTSQQFGERLYEKLFDKGDLFLVVSELGKSRLIEQGCDGKKILVHHSGINYKKFSFLLRRPHANSQIRLLTIGRLVEMKGVEYSIRAVARLVKLNANIKYSIVGDGPLREDLEKLVHDLNIAHRVEFLGEKQQQEIIEILNNSDILLASSVTDKNGFQEGIPNVLKEAMASGLPVISTNYSGVPELVENGVSGYLSPERNVDALTETLGYLIAHPEVWPDFGQAGRIRVEEQYDIDKLNDQLVKIYQQLLDGHLE